MDDALLSRNNAELASWLTALRPTSSVGHLTAHRLPLRVIDCQATVESQRIICVQPQDWDFTIISHRWSTTTPWEAYRRPWPAIGGMMITASRRDSIMALAGYIPFITGSRFFWIDCVCIDQESSLEKGREILNMGSYYEKAEHCLIFPEGVDLVSPPIRQDGSRPSWYERAWTLQEEVLSRPRARYLFSSPISDPSIVPTGWNEWITAFGWDGNFSHVHDISGLLEWERNPGVQWKLYAVPASMLSQALGSCLDTAAGTAAQERILALLHANLASRQWTMVDVLRQMYHRDAARTEDLIYGCLGLLGIRLPSTPYGVGLRDALKILVDTLHVDQRLLLCAVEAYHGLPSSIDGYSTLPAWREPGAMCAPRFRILRTLGTGNFAGHHGMDVFSPCSNGRISLQESTREVIDNIGSPLHMFRLPYHQDRDDDNDVSTSNILTLHNLGEASPKSARSRKITLVAFAECDFYTATPRAILAAPDPDVLFLCMMCTQHGVVLRKNGLAVVRAASHSWIPARYCIA